MANIKRFEDLEVWKKARVLSKTVFKLSKEGEFAKDFRFRDQITAASSSIMDNIAEGFERNGNNELRQFLSIAKASAGEVRSQLWQAIDREYISQETFEELLSLSQEISKMITSWMSYLKTTDLKGIKYKN